MGRLARDETAEPVSRDQLSGANGNMEKTMSPVHLTTSRTSNLTQLVRTLAICDDHTKPSQKLVRKNLGTWSTDVSEETATVVVLC